jgi:hypothetical protein
MATQQSQQIEGDNFASMYKKSDKGNIFTFMNQITDEVLESELKNLEVGKSYEYGNYFWSKSQGGAVFRKSPQEQKDYESKQQTQGGQKRATPQWDYFEVKLLPFDEANKLLERDHYIVDQMGTSIVQQVLIDGKLEPRLLIGKRKLRNPWQFMNTGNGSTSEQK